MLFMFCLAVLPCTYIYSFIPGNELLGCIGFFVLNIFVNFFDVILMFVATLSQGQSTSGQTSGIVSIVKLIRYVLAVLFPSVNFKRALFNIRLKSNSICLDAVNSVYGENLKSDESWMSLTDPGLGVSFIFFIVQMLAFWIILTIIEKCKSRKQPDRCCCCCCCESDWNKETDVWEDSVRSECVWMMVFIVVVRCIAFG